MKISNNLSVVLVVSVIVHWAVVMSFTHKTISSLAAEFSDIEGILDGLNEKTNSAMESPAIHVNDGSATSCEIVDGGEFAEVTLIELSSSSGTNFGAVDTKELQDAPPTMTSTRLSSSSATSFEVINASELLDLSPTKPSTASSPMDGDKNIPEKVRKWQLEYAKMLQEKDAEERIKQQELRETARKELEEFYRTRTQAIAKTKYQNRTTEEPRSEESQNVVDWDRVVALCDFSSKIKAGKKDVSRMREVILHMNGILENGKLS